jgi:hypothetical protein
MANQYYVRNTMVFHVYLTRLPVVGQDEEARREKSAGPVVSDEVSARSSVEICLVD